jgi:2-phosphoglycolate phosphatase
MKAILFDLDGTFADTAPDLGYALNLQRAARGHAPLPIEPLRKVASSGARGLLGVGFGLKPGDAEYEAMRDEFLALYEQNLCRDTRLFPGIPELLDGIEGRGLAWGIVTNKATRFTRPLLELLGITPRAGCVVCGDTTPHTKPHPAPMFAAAKALGVDPATCIYVGDDERDMLAGRAAGMRVAVASYGYLGNGKPPEQWDADHWLADPRELLPLI